MLQHFSHQALVKSTIFGCLLLSSCLIPLESTVANPQILTTPPAKTINQQVRQDAIYSLRKPAQKVPPTAMVKAAIRQAKEWGYPGQPLLKNISSEKTTWTSSCENVSPPNTCDPIVFQGWKITIPHQRQRWVFQGETADNLELIARSNPVIERGLPMPVSNEIKRIASKHLQILPSVALITKIEPQTFTNSCLGLGNLAESCAQQTIRGYRVTVAGKSPARQIYRISNNQVNIRTEAIAGLPTRTDELPTAAARTIFNAAKSDLKQPIANLSISQVTPNFSCFRSPTAAPNEPCLPTQRLESWNVTVTNFQKSLTYKVNLDGKILSKR